MHRYRIVLLMDNRIIGYRYKNECDSLLYVPILTDIPSLRQGVPYALHFSARSMAESKDRGRRASCALVTAVFAVPCARAIRLRGDNQHGYIMRYEPVKHLSVGGHRFMTNIEQETDKVQILCMEEVLLDKLCPCLSALTRRLGITIARQIDQVYGMAFLPHRRCA